MTKKMGQQESVNRLESATIKILKKIKKGYILKTC